MLILLLVPTQSALLHLSCHPSSPFHLCLSRSSGRVKLSKSVLIIRTGILLPVCVCPCIFLSVLSQMLKGLTLSCCLPVSHPPPPPPTLHTYTHSHTHFGDLWWLVVAAASSPGRRSVFCFPHQCYHASNLHTEYNSSFFVMTSNHNDDAQGLICS